MSSSDLGLDNLTAIIDRNGLQITGSTEETVRLEPLGARWRAFGWAVHEVDGHNLARPAARDGETVEGAVPRSSSPAPSRGTACRPYRAASRATSHGWANASTPALWRFCARGPNEEKMSPAARDAYRDRLIKLMADNDRLYCLDSDTGLFAKPTSGGRRTGT